MSASDSQVVEALQVPSNLERVLSALGCDTTKDSGAAFESPHGYISCPMPDHPDRNPSCSVLADAGILECRSLCGTVRPLDLVIAHGRASNRGDAAKWIEQLLGIERSPVGPPAIVVDDPSVSVEQYLALKHLSAATVERFALADVRIHEDPSRARRGYASVFEKGWHGAVLMPNDPPGVALEAMAYRPRVRNIFGARWPATVIDAAGRRVQFSRASDHAPATELAHVQRVYGVPQFQPAADSDALARTILVVEGESDVHALHDMQIPFCLGLPGVGAYRAGSRDIVSQLLTCTAGDVEQLPSWTVLVWSEPGAAGAKLPGDLAGAIAAHCADLAIPAPRVASLPCSHLRLTPSAAAAGGGGPVKDPCELIARLVPLHHGSPAPAREEAAQIMRDAMFVGAGRAPLELDERAPVAAVEPASVAMPDPEVMQRGSDPWELMDSDGELPAPDPLDLPEKIEHLGATFIRTTEGWAERVETKEKLDIKPVATIFDVHEVLEIDGEDWLVVRAPRRHLLSFQTTRFARSELSDSKKVAANLGAIGVSIAMRRTPQVAAICQALAERHLARVGAKVMPAATGWSGRPGTSAFGGIDSEPVNQLGSRMYDSNVKRRARNAQSGMSVEQAALRWWNEGVEPLLKVPARGGPGTAAPMLAIGAAAAAPLVGPLAEAGISVSPVVWIAGIGGGGKSITQKLCASIFAPCLPDLDGQSAYFANANISQAALSARVDSCRDLPLILDDVTQLPPNPNSQVRGDGARIEAAAALGMLVFNRKPIERATRDGGIRATRAFRSTAIFSAEVSMASEVSRAVITAGHRRRISTIEAQPMTERGLGQPYAETVNTLAATVGGAPGELHVAQIRSSVSDRSVRRMFERVRDRITRSSDGKDVTLTQRENIAVSVLGFAMLADSIGAVEFEEAVDRALAMLEPYFDTGAGAGGATKDSDLSGVAAAQRSIDDMRASHLARFDDAAFDGHDIPPPTMGYIGKQLRSANGYRRVVLLRQGIDMLMGKYGVTMQVIEQAVHDGLCVKRHQFRMSGGQQVFGMLWRLPLPTGDDDEDAELAGLSGEPEPHDGDPHGLARPYVPGSWATDVEPGGENQSATNENQTGTSAHMIRFEQMAQDRELNKFRVINYASDSNDQESDIVTRFGWGQGLYVVESGPESRADEQLLHRVRREAQLELEALDLQYRRAAELDDLGELGDPIVVAPFPPDDDPRWERIDALGADAARDQWNETNLALERALQAKSVEARRQAHVEHVKHYRVHLMARYRNPGWFIVGTRQR